MSVKPVGGPGGVGGGGSSLGLQHTVKRGETLDAIAAKHDVSSAAITKLNPQIAGMAKLPAGLVLSLPERSTAAPSASPPTRSYSFEKSKPGGLTAESAYKYAPGEASAGKAAPGSVTSYKFAPGEAAQKVAPGSQSAYKYAPGEAASQKTAPGDAVAQKLAPGQTSVKRPAS